MAASLDIIVSVKGDGTAEIKKVANAAKEAEGSTKNLKQSTDQLSSSFGMLKGAIAAVGVGALIKEGIQLADTYKLMNARLTLAVSSTNELAKAQTELYKMAQGSRSSLEATTALYTKLEMATDSMGKSQAEVLRVTEAVGKALKISGAGAAESASAMMQLGQALASGVLRGDELNSIMENAPRLAKSIADGLGVTIGQLRTMGAEGQLTAEKVFTAIEKSGAKLDSEFKKIPPTVSDSVTQIENSLLKLVGATDTAVNGTGGLADTITSFSQFLDNNQKDIIEFGSDFYKSLQMMGAGVIGLVTGFMGVVDGIAGGVAFGLEFMLNKLVAMVNSALSLAEGATNKVRTAFGGEAVSFGQFATFDFAGDILEKSATRFKESANAFKTVNVIAKDIASFTTVMGKANEVTNQSNNKKGGKALSKEELAKQKKEADEYAKSLEGIEKLSQSIREDYIKKIISDYENEEKYKLELLQDRADAEAKVAIDQYELELDLDKKRYKEQQAFWDDLFENINKSMESQFFDAMTGKFESFGDWLKDFWSSITNSMMRGLSKTLADTIMGTGTQSGGIQNIFSSFGMFGGSTGSSATYGVGTSLGTSALSSISGSTDSQGFKTTAGGTVLSSNGTVVTAGTDFGDIVKSIPVSNSYLDSAWNTVGGWFGSGATTGTSLSNSSHLTSYAASDGFNTGLASTASSSGASSFMSTLGTWAGWTAFFKTLSGYLWGDGGGGALDKMFGANTNAGAYHDSLKYGMGAFNWNSLTSGNGQAVYGGTGYGGASNWKSNLSFMSNPMNFVNNGLAGSIMANYTAMNPLAGITGHVDPITAGILGGIMGKTTVKALPSSYNLSDITQDSANGYFNQAWKVKTSSWFGSSSKTKTSSTALGSDTLNGLMQVVNTYDTILEQLGYVQKMVVKGGTFSTLDSWLNTNVLYSFFDVLTTANEVEVTNTWKKYAESINKTVIEAFSEVVGGKLSFERSFTEWRLGSGSKEQLKFTSDYLQSDLTKYAQSIGAIGVTADNFLEKYNQAMETLYTPETSEAWQKLGQSLMSATDATKAYNDALSASVTVVPSDMMLSRVASTTSPIAIRDMVAQQQQQNTQTSQMVAQLYEVIKVLKAQLTIAQFGTNQGIPA